MVLLAKMDYRALRENQAIPEPQASLLRCVCRQFRLHASRVLQDLQVRRDFQEIKGRLDNLATPGPPEKIVNQLLQDHQVLLVLLVSPDRLVPLVTLGNLHQALRQVLGNLDHLDKLAHKAHLALTVMLVQMEHLVDPDPKVLLGRQVRLETTEHLASLEQKVLLEKQENRVFVQNIAHWTEEYSSQTGYEDRSFRYRKPRHDICHLCMVPTVLLYIEPAYWIIICIAVLCNLP